jgi:hypothetical protein
MFFLGPYRGFRNVSQMGFRNVVNVLFRTVLGLQKCRKCSLSGLQKCVANGLQKCRKCCRTVPGLQNMSQMGFSNVVNVLSRKWAFSNVLGKLLLENRHSHCPGNNSGVVRTKDVLVIVTVGNCQRVCACENASARVVKPPKPLIAARSKPCRNPKQQMLADCNRAPETWLGT